VGVGSYASGFVHHALACAWSTKLVMMFTQQVAPAPAVQLRCARVRPALRMRAQGRRVGYARVGRVVRLAVAAAGKYDGLGQVVTVLGSQWGDEGKGKLVDILAQQTDVIVRAQVHPQPYGAG
jgi:hypothetical protein